MDYENLNKYPNLMSIEDIVEFLCTTRITVYGLIKSGKIKAAKVGKTWKVSKNNFIEYLNNIGLF